MSILNLITLFGGLAIFLYGMRIMGDGLKESSAGQLKKAMEKFTNTPVKAFLLGLVLQVVDDIVSDLKENHMERLRSGGCSTFTGAEFLNLLSEAERISDVCSNIGVATIARAKPEIKHQIHSYVSVLHAGGDKEFNREYQEAHEHYFGLL